MNAKQEQTYRLPGVKAEDGTPGTLVFDVKPGGNVHADFEPDAAPDQSLPEPSETPAEPTAGQLPADPAEQVDEPGPQGR